MKEKRFTPNVSGSETYATAKNGRRLLKVKCASCGITKTRFISGVNPTPRKTQGGGAQGGRGSPRYDMRIYAGNRVDDPTNPLYQRGAGFDLHKAIGRLPKPKKGWTLPGHNYTGPYNPLEKQLSYDPQTGKILKIYQQPTGATDAVAMQHDVDYAVCTGKKNEKSCKHFADKKMVKALDAIPKNKRQWGQAAARNAISSKQKVGLGVGETINKKIGEKIPGFQPAQDAAAAIMAITGGDKDLFKKYWSGAIAKGAFNTKTGLFSKKFWTPPKKGCRMELKKINGKWHNTYGENC